MSWTVPTSAIEQMDDELNHTEQDDETRSFAWRDDYNTLKTSIATLAKGDVVKTGYLASSWRLTRTPGGYGLLIIFCSAATSSGDTPADGLLKDTWSIKSVRNDVSILAYCGPTPGSNPNREEIETWMKEPDATLARQYQYKAGDGQTITISNSLSKDLIDKIRKGIDSVIRFYPLVVRKRVYESVPPACLENLGYIDTPPAPATNAKNPDGLSTAISAHQWLKVQDDADEGTDGKWTRTESWMGILKTTGNSSPWDADLYGSGRWPMPRTNGSDGGGGTQ